MSFPQRVCELLDIKYPLLSAPMAGVAGGLLASAVSAAGGLGFIGGGYCERDFLKREIAAAQALGHPFGVGFITWALDKNPSVLSLALAARPVAIMLSFGDIRRYVGDIQAYGVKVIAQVQTVAQARDVLAAGVDIIVAQGSDAGGHTAQRGTMALIPGVVDAVGSAVPVIAAGGLADGRGMAAAFVLGADGVMMGTRFYACVESLAHPRAKDLVVASDGDHTVRTAVIDIVRDKPWSREYKLRMLSNKFVEQWHGNEAKLRQQLKKERERYEEGTKTSNFDVRPVIVGEAVDLIQDVPTAKEIVLRVVQQAEKVLEFACHAKL